MKHCFSQKKIITGFVCLLTLVITYCPAYAVSGLLTKFVEYAPSNSLFYLELKPNKQDANNILKLLDDLSAKHVNSLKDKNDDDSGVVTNKTKPALSVMFDKYFYPEVGLVAWMSPVVPQTGSVNSTDSIQNIFSALVPESTPKGVVGMVELKENPTKLTMATNLLPISFVLAIRTKTTLSMDTFASAKSFSLVKSSSIKTPIYADDSGKLSVALDGDILLIASNTAALEKALFVKNSHEDSFQQDADFSDILGRLPGGRFGSVLFNFKISAMQGALDKLQQQLSPSTGRTSSKWVSAFLTEYISFLQAFYKQLGPDYTAKGIIGLSVDKLKKQFDFETYTLSPNWDKIPDAEARDLLHSYYNPTNNIDANLADVAGKDASVVISTAHIGSILKLLTHVYESTENGPKHIEKYKTLCQLMGVNTDTILDLLDGSVGLVWNGPIMPTPENNEPDMTFLISNVPAAKQLFEVDGAMSLLIGDVRPKRLYKKHLFLTKSFSYDKKQKKRGLLYYGELSPAYYGVGATKTLKALPITSQVPALKHDVVYQAISEGISSPLRTFSFIDFAKAFPESDSLPIKALLMTSGCEPNLCNMLYRVQY